MPLYIRDDEVAALARKVQGLTKARTVTDAVRSALEHEIERERNKLPPSARLARSVAMAAAMGPVDPDFDMKKFSDEMWGE
ncbi:MAG: type II toxin-antitoxin system VapB family antitoxin [Roseiarcus sp.]